MGGWPRPARMSASLISPDATKVRGWTSIRLSGADVDKEAEVRAPIIHRHIVGRSFSSFVRRRLYRRCKSAKLPVAQVAALFHAPRTSHPRRRRVPSLMAQWRQRQRWKRTMMPRCETTFWPPPRAPSYMRKGPQAPTRRISLYRTASKLIPPRDLRDASNELVLSPDVPSRWPGTSDMGLLVTI